MITLSLSSEVYLGSGALEAVSYREPLFVVGANLEDRQRLRHHKRQIDHGYPIDKGPFAQYKVYELT
jgi:hypothetical protein